MKTRRMTKKNYKTHKTHKTHKRSKKTYKNNIGGSVVASGGYGCIFDPSLKCKEQPRETGMISKLMTKKNAASEYEDIMKYKQRLEKIPNYEDYFLINNVTLCDLDPLTESDMTNYDTKCKALLKDKITKKKVNGQIQQRKLQAINMPNGGLDIGDFMETHESLADIQTLNVALIQLLRQGIVPMNKQGVYHCDVKEANILVDSTFKTRLIDWGLSTPYNNEPVVPKPLTRRPFQYNVPFSVILFNSSFSQSYADFLQLHPIPSYYQVRTFTIDYIFMWMEERGIGHIRTINKFMKMLFEHDIYIMDKEDRYEIIEFEFTYYYIIEYISKVIHTFTRDGSFDLMRYFSQVFIKNVDVWGFVMSYSPIMEYLYNKFDELNDKEKQLFNKLKHIFITFLFESAVEPIHITTLVKELESINILLSDSSTSSVASVSSINDTSSTSPSPSPTHAVKIVTLTHNKTSKSHSPFSSSSTHKHISR